MLATYWFRSGDRSVKVVKDAGYLFLWRGTIDRVQVRGQRRAETGEVAGPYVARVTFGPGAAELDFQSLGAVDSFLKDNGLWQYWDGEVKGE